MNKGGPKALSSILMSEERGKLTFIYSPSLITVWKHLLIKAKVKTIN